MIISYLKIKQMFSFKKLLSRLFKVNSVINQTNDSGTSNSSNNLKQYTDVKEVEALIEKAQKSGKGQNLKMDISLNPNDYDYLAKKYPQYKLYLSLNVELKIEAATTYKAYVQTLQLLREGWNLRKSKIGFCFYTIWWISRKRKEWNRERLLLKASKNLTKRRFTITFITVKMIYRHEIHNQRW